MFFVYESKDLILKYSPQIDLESQGISYQIPAKLFVETNKCILKFIRKCKGPRRAKFTRCCK